nr:SDR family oxidoreductase [uncultured Dyadobacter sp.]
MSNSAFPRILITGATGTIGRELTAILSSRNIPFRAMVRSLDRAGELAGLPGAELVIGDFNEPATLENALAGMERAFLLTHSSELAEKQQSTFVALAAKAGLKHIVKLSQWAADVTSPVRFLRYHAEVENRIRDSGMTYTFLRPNLFMQGLLGFRDSIVYQGKFFGAIGDARISMVDTRDIARVAAAALTGPGHEGKTYNLTGPEALSHQDLAAKLSDTLGRAVEFVDVPPAALHEMLIGVGFSDWQAEGLVEDYAHYKRGEAEVVSDHIFEAILQKPINIDSFLDDYHHFFA